MANRIFVIADTHFGHESVIKFESINRPFKTIKEHDEALIDSWNSTVDKRDTIWHLGDVLFGKHSFEILGRLKGVKKLVMGNHDRYPISEYLKYFNRICGVQQLHGYLLSHIPVNPSQKYRYKGNIHGHMHSGALDDEWYTCVSVERTGLKPVLFDEIIHG